MARPYTIRLIEVTGPGQMLTWQCPTGKRAIVRSVLARSEDGAGGRFFLGVNGIWAYSWDTPDNLRGLNVEMRAVAYAMEDVAVYTTGVDMRVIVTGYLFDDLDGPPAQTKPIEPDRPVVGPHG